MKKGFTMIELIFVIVILGILAAVAIPKLAATRDDARVAGALTDLATCISDAGTSFTATGTTLGTSQSCVNIAAGCFTITIATATDGNFTIAGNGNQATDNYCVNAISKANDKNLIAVHSFGGTGVTY